MKLIHAQRGFHIDGKNKVVITSYPKNGYSLSVEDGDNNHIEISLTPKQFHYLWRFIGEIIDLDRDYVIAERV